MMPGIVGRGGAAAAPTIKLRVFRFDVQFCWQPKALQQANAEEQSDAADEEQ